jgi:hypothetical protein
VSRSGPESKPFLIPKQLVWEAYRRVKANKGAAGVDEQSLGEFESDLRNNLYKIWNRMSSGDLFSASGDGGGDTQGVGGQENSRRADGSRKLRGRAGHVKFRNRLSR